MQATNQLQTTGMARRKQGLKNHSNYWLIRQSFYTGTYDSKSVPRFSRAGYIVYWDTASSGNGRSFSSSILFRAKHRSDIPQPRFDICPPTSKAPHLAPSDVTTSLDTNQLHACRVSSARDPVVGQAPPDNALVREENFRGAFEATGAARWHDPKEAQKGAEDEARKIDIERRV